jgi:hypothetical protein
MNESLMKILSNLKMKPIWNLRISVGSILLFEVGEKIKKTRQQNELYIGTYSFCVYCPWRITNHDTNTIWVNSSSININEKLFLIEDEVIKEVLISHIGDIKLILSNYTIEIWVLLIEDDGWDTNWDMLYNGCYYSLNNKLTIETEQENK